MNFNKVFIFYFFNHFMNNFLLSEYNYYKYLQKQIIKKEYLFDVNLFRSELFIVQKYLCPYASLILDYSGKMIRDKRQNIELNCSFKPFLKNLISIRIYKSKINEAFNKIHQEIKHYYDFNEIEAIDIDSYSENNQYFIIEFIIILKNYNKKCKLYEECSQLNQINNHFFIELIL